MEAESNKCDVDDDIVDEEETGEVAAPPKEPSRINGLTIDEFVKVTQPHHA